MLNRDGRNVLLMGDGVVHRKVVGGELSVIRFGTYAFDLAAFNPDSEQVYLFAKDRTLGFLLNPDPQRPVYKQFPAGVPRRAQPALSPNGAMPLSSP